MDSLSLATIGLALLFLVPGYVIHSIVAVTTPRRSEVEKLLFLRFLTFSTINFVVNVGIVASIKHDFEHHRPILSACHTLLALWSLFLSPVVIGAVISFIDQRGLVRKVFDRIGIRTMLSIPTAWDTQFQNICGDPTYMIVTMKNAERFFGYFGDASCASSDPNERDIYLQKQYKLDADENWQPIEKSGGLLLKGTEIVSIELRWESDERKEVEKK